MQDTFVEQILYLIEPLICDSVAASSFKLCYMLAHCCVTVLTEDLILLHGESQTSNILVPLAKKDGIAILFECFVS